MASFYFPDTLAGPDILFSLEPIVSKDLEESKELHDTLKAVVLESLNEIKTVVLLNKLQE